MKSVSSLPSVATASQRWWHAALPALAVLLVSLIATFVVWQVERNEDDIQSAARLEVRSLEIQNSIQARMSAYEQILRGGVSLFAVIGEVSRDEWAQYCKHLNAAAHFNGIHGMGFARRVLPAEKTAFVQRIRQQGLPDYDIRPGGDRAQYVPVTYLEPQTERNLNAHGFDMLSEPTRRAAMLSAIDTGNPAITGKLKLAAEPDKSPIFGFLVYLPVFKLSMPLTTRDEREAALLGFVNSPFRINDFLMGLLGEHRDHINLTLYDGPAVNTDSKMYSKEEKSLPHLRGVEAWWSALLPVRTVAPKTMHITVHDRTWTLVLTPLPAFSYRENVTALLVVVSGTVISVLLSALMLTVSLRMRLIKHSAQHYLQLANFDSLTGLPNRAMFHDRLDRNLLQAQRFDRPMALLFIDIDHFKAINDSLGHHMDDALLKEVALRIESCIRKADTVARLGGDEFTVILSELHDASFAGKVAHNILSRLAEPFLLDAKQSTPMKITASVGIALYPSQAADANTLLKNADHAMYTAKKLGRNQFQYYELPMETLT